jgi:hypothetical protein
MKLQNISSGKIIDVPTEHAQGVLLPQGKYIEYKEPEKPKLEVVDKPKKRGRPKKVS